MIQVKFRKEALADIERIYSYIAQNNPEIALVVADRIYKTTGLLELFPEAGRRGIVHSTREFIIPKTPFIIVYKFQKDYVDIIAVFHGAQDR